jgi:hypothetical protein
MRPIPINPDTEVLARRMIWFESSDQALADPIRFMAYVFAQATPEDLTIIRRYVADEEFSEALDKAPPGIIDARSWGYWNARIDRYPTPPLPRGSSGEAGLAARVAFGGTLQRSVPVNQLQGLKSD